MSDQITHLKIKNVKTEKVYGVTRDGWNTIVEKGMASRFEVVEEIRPVGVRTSMIPPAIAAAAIAEAERTTTNEQPTKATKAAK